MQHYAETDLAAPILDPQRRYLCRHIHTRGQRCGSPALRGEQLCYYHTRARVEAPIAGRSGTFPMPRIDDRTAIQLALYDLLSRIAGGDIDLKRGSILLHGLQIASLNLSRRIPTEPAAPPQVEELTHHHHLGDLAPIAEVPTPPPTTAARHSHPESNESEQPPYFSHSTTTPMSSAALFSGVFALAKHPETNPTPPLPRSTGLAAEEASTCAPCLPVHSLLPALPLATSHG